MKTIGFPELIGSGNPEAHDYAAGLPRRPTLSEEIARECAGLPYGVESPWRAGLRAMDRETRTCSTCGLETTAKEGDAACPERHDGPGEYCPLFVDGETRVEVSRRMERREMRPHNYFPSPMHQGDCGVCGRPGDHVIHTRSKP